MKLSDWGFSPEEMFTHPRHQTAQELLPELIVQLRACANVKDGYEFQQRLLALVLEVEGDRNAFSMAIKRMRVGKPPQPGVPEPPSGLDPGRLETWQLEHDVCERVARQFRCVGDALAWRMFGFDRRHIIALCQNEPPGVMAGKAGLTAELQRVEQAWREDGQFAILHDRTNCLRIGDVTVFADDGSPDARSGDERARTVLVFVARALDQLRNLPGPPNRASETATLRWVRQPRRYPLWRVSHAYHPQVAVRLICWFPPEAGTVVVALFAADKARLGDVFYGRPRRSADRPVETRDRL